MATQTAWWSRGASVLPMPPVQVVRGVRERGETGDGIDEIGVVSLVAPEVLTPES